MKLIAGGDSFVWGSELADHKHAGPGGHSLSTFAALLSQKHGLEYRCVAMPGSGNDSIARRVISACSKNKNAVVLASWTWNMRYEFRFAHDNRWDTVSASQYELGSKLNVPHRDFIKHFFRSVGFSNYWETYSSLREMLRLQDYLKLRNIPYMFTISDNWFDNAYAIQHQDDDIRALHSEIDWSRWYFFPAGTQGNHTLTPRGFYQWAIEEGYEIAPQHHPLEPAHRDAAKMMSDHFLTMLRSRP